MKTKHYNNKILKDNSGVLYMMNQEKMKNTAPLHFFSNKGLERKKNKKKIDLLHRNYTLGNNNNIMSYKLEQNKMKLNYDMLNMGKNKNNKIYNNNNNINNTNTNNNITQSPTSNMKLSPNHNNGNNLYIKNGHNFKVDKYFYYRTNKIKTSYMNETQRTKFLPSLKNVKIA
ncbi:hypothetical protein HEP_00533300, partial [Hepatocystis sp. ex Piliocolobus tephrosceles]